MYRSGVFIAIWFVCGAVTPATAQSPAPGVLARFLERPEADFERIVFAARVPGDDHWYANFGFYSSPVREYPPQRAPEGVQLPPAFKDGGRLCLLHLRDKALTVLLDDPAGGIRDPQVHYDGGKILFSYRRGGDPFYHLHEINADGSGLKQLTDGPHNDFEPAYLPGGGIVFCSDRCNRFVNCWITPVAVLYRCEGDGSALQPISANIEHDNTPWVLPDGRILYMRWEYVDRSQVHFHHLWTMNPDGTGQMVYYGNQTPGITMIDAKPIPGGDEIVASFSPDHGLPEHAGFLTRVNPLRGPDAKESAVRFSKDGPVWRDPYPLSGEFFLAARGNKIALLDGAGNSEIVFELSPEDGARFCHEPCPLRPRPREAVIPPHMNPEKTAGTFVLADVYQGRNMTGVQRGDIQRLLVLEQLPKPVSFSGGMWPISEGGTFTLARILGTVPVEDDGSACFEVPAMRPVFFVALDKDGLSVQRMHSFTSVMPGETTGCVGCHESRLATRDVSGKPLAAMQRPPSVLAPIENIPDVMDFPRDVQPILDKLCVPCHNPARMEGNVDFSGDHTPLFSVSYLTLLRHGLIADGRNEAVGNRPPRTVGGAASRLLRLVDGSHYEARATALERDTLRLWIESSAPYAGTYAALGSGMFPVHFPIEVLERRCGACHGSPPPEKGAIYSSQYFAFDGKKPAYPLVDAFLDLQQIRAQIGYYKFGDALPPQGLCNLTHPENSLLLRAPLAAAAGGVQRCGGPPVFSGTDDPDYTALLDAIRAAAAKEQTEKRFDMPGFAPNDYYLYQMHRYGILAQPFQPGETLDGYALDRAYWQSFWYLPERQ